MKRMSRDERDAWFQKRGGITVRHATEEDLGGAQLYITRVCPRNADHYWEALIDEWVDDQVIYLQVQTMKELDCDCPDWPG